MNGPSTAPIYQFLKSNAGGFLGDLIKWNFEKFLIDKKGKVVERYPPTTSPFQIEVRLTQLLPVQFISVWFPVHSQTFVFFFCCFAEGHQEDACCLITSAHERPHRLIVKYSVLETRFCWLWFVYIVTIYILLQC